DADHDIAWRGPGASFSLRRCPLSGETVDFFATGSRSVAASAGVAHLRSGRYLLALTGDPLVSTTLSVTAPRAGRACADPMPLSPEDEQLVIAPEAGRTTTRFFVAPS